MHMMIPERAFETLRAACAGDGAAPDRWTQCRVIEALYDPGARLRIAYALCPSDDVPDARVWPQADVAYIHYPVRSPVSRRGLVLNADGAECELYWFPNDRRLRGLRRFAGRQGAAGTWARWLAEDEPNLRLLPDTLRRSLVRYVPEQKWIARLRTRCDDLISAGQVKRAIAVRSASPPECRRIFSRNIALRRVFGDADGTFALPRPLTLDVHSGLLAVDWVWGESLVEHLGARGPDFAFSRVAEGLGALHAARIPEVDRFTDDDLLSASARAADDLSAAVPQWRALLAGLTRDLGGTRPSAASAPPEALIHNDFHWNQLCFKRARAYLLDLDRLCLGDALVDVANLAVQLMMLPHRDELAVAPPEARQWADCFLRH